ncbi:hypothetical protein ABFS82_09G056800 [Erythranthe guttata]|uniref:uncharacterized protein LOC105948981 n=1 Tax=Erythranthe guttata TaxID=4155 RepID=UPI00064DF3B1|nr:PREDICTED: uncharacterized protein LOC105948981 [Erythranthe guttata]|eukprot:XP_012827698.1 PREDICTED: uncharacterized protein LOC105948981 [Erythranthe guttata]
MATIVYPPLIPPNTRLRSRRPFSRQLPPRCNTTITASATTENLRVVFAAGGTGGHIYPALAIADELKISKPKTQFLFVGTPNGMEATAVPAAGYPFTAVPTAPLARPLISFQNFFLLPYLLTKSTLKSYKIIREFDPHIVIGTGGFVSFPTCLAAAIRGGGKLLIQEQNSVPGIANLVLSLFADKVCVAFNSTLECFWQKYKCVVCGNPVRFSLTKQTCTKSAARRHFFPNAAVIGKEKVVLVLGGSLGATTINIALSNVYCSMLNENEDLFVVWQTGLKAFREIESRVRNHPRLLLSPFLNAMDLAYAAADVIVSRSGAMTCSEILATGKPCILIPSPNVAEGHQFKNASLMADLAGSRVILEDELNSVTLRNAIQEIVGNERVMAEMCERAVQAAKPNASALIVEHILSLTRELGFKH